MRWEQDIVNAQVSVNRSVFEMNCNGRIKTDTCYKEKPDKNYIVREIREAVKSLQNALTELEETLDFKE